MTVRERNESKKPLLDAPEDNLELKIYYTQRTISQLIDLIDDATCQKTSCCCFWTIRKDSKFVIELKQLQKLAQEKKSFSKAPYALINTAIIQVRDKALPSLNTTTRNRLTLVFDELLESIEKAMPDLKISPPPSPITAGNSSSSSHANLNA